MKKLLCSCSSLVVLAACSSVLAGGPDHFAAPVPPPPPPEIQYFNGLNIGINGSGMMFNFDTDVHAEDSFGNKAFSSAEGNDYTGYGGVQATFGKVFRDIYYVGVQGYGNFGEGKDENSATLNNFLVFAQNPTIQSEAGVNLKPGVIVGPDRKTLVYALGGATWGLIQAQAQITDDSVSEKEWELGWLAGLGAERFIDDNGNFSVNAQYTYSSFGGVRADDNEIDAENKVRQSAFTVGLNYYPGFAL